MPAEFSLADLEALNGTSDRVGAEKQRLKDLSKSITRYAETGTPEPEPEPGQDAFDENELLERVLKRAQEKMREAQNPTVLSTADIAAANEAKYGKPDQPIKEQALRKSIANVKDEPDNFPLSSIISDAYDLGASDVYIQSDTPIRFKIGSGVSTYRVQPNPTRTDIARLLEAVVLDGDTTVFNANQELDISYTVPRGKYAGRRCRLNVTYVSPGLGNINMVFRLLAGDILLPENYNVPETFIKSMHSKGGLNVIAGVTGSGKTTTTASCLLYAQYNVTTPNPKTGEPMGVVIVTIEQPIEYLFDSNNPNGNGSIFIQREVNVDTISYLNGIKSALRQNPNIMLIGEVRTEEEIQAEVKKRVEENALRPPPVYLPVATVDSERTFDPSYTVERDLADHKGQVFAHKGQVVNPFDTVPFARTLIFIDGDDEKQIEWLKSFKPQTQIVKIILLNGDLREVTEKLDTDLYFDQNGALVKRFGIKAIPSVIDEMPNQKLLRIREFGLK